MNKYLKDQSDPIPRINRDWHARREQPALHNAVHILLDLPHRQRRVGPARLDGRGRHLLKVAPVQHLPILVPYQNLTDQNPLLVGLPLARHGQRRRAEDRVGPAPEEVGNRFFGSLQVKGEVLVGEGEGRGKWGREMGSGDFDGGLDELGVGIARVC